MTCWGNVVNATIILVLFKNTYQEKFLELQQLTVDATNVLVSEISPGQSEKQIADRYNQLLEKRGFKEHWYPILVYSGEITGKSISRRIHLPSEKIFVKENDIVFIDCTPLSGTVWTNWCDTIMVGKNDFLESIIKDTNDIVLDTTLFAKREAKNIGDLYDYCTNLIMKKNLEMLDPYQDVGHLIFQVPEGQTVDKTPMKNRILLNQQFGNIPLSGIVSIEPQLGRINPADGKMYGAKIQKVLIF